jgi:transketolase
MRAAFIKALSGLARRDARVILLTGDLGFMVVEEFARAHPQRFINVGVAEANMIGLATGLATRGFLPFCYSIATFASMRGYEQLRNGPVVHHLPVRVVGIGGGFAYGSAGLTHYALEDLGLARLQPDLVAIAPADDAQAVAALEATYALDGPIYYRIGKDHQTIPGLEGRFRPGGVETLGHGADLLFLTTGAMTLSVVAAAERLAEHGIRATVAVLAWVHPAPLPELTHLLRRFPIALTVEDHYATGGIGSLVAEVAVEHARTTRVIRCGVTSVPRGRSGSEAYQRAQAGLSPAQIVARARAAVGSRQVAA